MKFEKTGKLSGYQALFSSLAKEWHYGKMLKV